VIRFREIRCPVWELVKSISIHGTYLPSVASRNRDLLVTGAHFSFRLRDLCRMFCRRNCAGLRTTNRDDHQPANVLRSNARRAWLMTCRQLQPPPNQEDRKTETKPKTPGGGRGGKTHQGKPRRSGEREGGGEGGKRKRKTKKRGGGGEKKKKKRGRGKKK